MTEVPDPTLFALKDKIFANAIANLGIYSIQEILNRAEQIMIEGKFDLVFRGQIIKNIEIDEVKSNLVSLFKSSPEAIEKLFMGSEVAVRKGLDYSTAMKYQSALKKAGALALIKEVESDEASDSSRQQPTSEPAKRVPLGKATFGVVDAQEKNSEKQVDEVSEPIQDTSPKVEEVVVSSELNSIANSGKSGEESMTIADAGVQLIPDKIYEKREVDTSDLSLASVGEQIMPDKEPDNTPAPSTDHLSLE